MQIGAIPYFSHIQITYAPTNRLQETGQSTQDGRSLLQVVQDKPGITCEVIPYLGTDDNALPGPAETLSFPLKAYFQDGLAAFKSIEQTDAVKKTIAQLEKDLADTSVVWCETLLAQAGAETINDLWADVIAEAIKDFPQWSAAQNAGLGGIELLAKVMQLDARIPAAGNRSVTVKIGLYRQKTVDGKKVEVGQPVFHELKFIDAAGIESRNNIVSQIETLLADKELAIKDLTGDNKKLVQYEIEQHRAQLAQLRAESVAPLSGLVGEASVAESLPKLMAALLLASTQTYPGIDVVKVGPLMTARLEKILALA